MARILFHEKPGCATNARQRQMLIAASHQLEVRSILSEDWTVERLLPYLAGRAIEQWFNPMAPRIKYGELDPTQLNSDAAMQWLIREPLLIRRPLLHWQTHYLQGFDAAQLITLQLLPDTSPAPLTDCSHPAQQVGACKAP